MTKHCPYCSKDLEIFDFAEPLILHLQAILLDLMIKHRYVIITPEREYRIVCNHNKDSLNKPKCPNNLDGVCIVKHKEIKWHELHKFDGFKMWKCPCG